MILKDHANGIEPVKISDIKKYKSKDHSISQGQILFEDYNYNDAKLVVKEMVEVLSLELIDKHLVTDSVGLMVGYSKDAADATGGVRKIMQTTNVYSILVENVLNLFDETTNKFVSIRRINLSFNNVKDELYEQLDLFTDPEVISKEKNLERTINDLKKRFGKNSILRGMNLEEKATTRKRNLLIGGHNSGEEE